MAWARNGTPDTLSGTSDTITISDLNARKFNQFLCHHLQTGGYPQTHLRLGYGSVDSGSNYSARYSYNGGTDATATSSTDIRLLNAVDTNEGFNVGYYINIASEEKLLMSFGIHANTSGAGTAPAREEDVGKWVNTSNQSDNIQIVNLNTGDYTTGSNLTVLTGDETETVTLQDGTIFEETDTNKAYIWNSSTETWTQL